MIEYIQNEQVNDRLKRLRETAEYTQNYVAEKLHVSIRTYQKYEAGEISIGVQQLNILADLYNCTSDYLLCRTHHKREGILEFSKNSDKYKVIYDNTEFKDIAKNEIKKEILNRMIDFLDKE